MTAFLKMRHGGRMEKRELFLDWLPKIFAETGRL
jgi:hypothetical protein